MDRRNGFSSKKDDECLSGLLAVVQQMTLVIKPPKPREPAPGPPIIRPIQTCRSILNNPPRNDAPNPNKFLSKKRTKMTVPPKNEAMTLTPHETMIEHYKNNTGTDGTVVIGDVVFKVHTCILKNYCALFRGWTNLNKFRLSEERCSPESFRVMYEWMRCGNDDKRHTWITKKNIVSLYSASKYLKMDSLQKPMLAILQNETVLTEGVAYDMYIEARQLNETEIAEMMLPRIRKFFLMLVSSQNFLDLSYADLKDILHSNYLDVKTEADIFFAALRWIKHDPENRLPLKWGLFNCVRFTNMSSMQLGYIQTELASKHSFEIIQDEKIAALIQSSKSCVELGERRSAWSETGFVPSGVIYSNYDNFLRALSMHRILNMKKTSAPLPSPDQNAAQASASPSGGRGRLPPGTRPNPM